MPLPCGNNKTNVLICQDPIFGKPGRVLAHEVDSLYSYFWVRFIGNHSVAISIISILAEIDNRGLS